MRTVLTVRKMCTEDAAMLHVCSLALLPAMAMGQEGTPHQMDTALILDTASLSAPSYTA